MAKSEKHHTQEQKHERAERNRNVSAREGGKHLSHPKHDAHDTLSNTVRASEESHVCRHLQIVSSLLFANKADAAVCEAPH